MLLLDNAHNLEEFKKLRGPLVIAQMLSSLNLSAQHVIVAMFS